MSHQTHPLVARPRVARRAVAAAGLAALPALGACADDALRLTPLTVVANPTSLSCETGQVTAIGLTITGGAGAPVVTFAGDGPVTAVAERDAAAIVTCGPATGAAQIVYTVTSGSQRVTGTIPIAVTPHFTSIFSLRVAPSAATLAPGDTTRLGATVTLPSNSPAGTSTGVDWVSADTSVATVSAAGLVTARRVGETSVFAIAVANRNLRAGAEVTVVAPAQP